MKKNRLDVLLVFGGILLAGVGLYLLKTVAVPQWGVTIHYLCIGVGCGAFGHGMGNWISCRALRNNPALQRQMEIEQKDERNIAITNRAKAKAYDMMIFLFGALMLSFALMGIDFMATLLLVFSYLLVVGYGVYYRCRYQKEM